MRRRLINKKTLETICKLNESWRQGKVEIQRAGGQTNSNWIVRCGGKKFFVRLPWERKDIVDRKTESRNIAALAKNVKLKKILPKYFIYILKGRNILDLNSKEVFNVADGAMVTEYIPGRIFTSELFKKPFYRKKLAASLYCFHTSGVRFLNQYDVFRDEIEKYRLVAKKHSVEQIVGPEIISELEDMEINVRGMLRDFRKGVSTHNDLIFQNFIVAKDGVYLLDFEYAGLNKKGGIYYDLGFLFADNLFRHPPITIESFERFLKTADKIYGRSLDRSQICWSAVAATLVMFWWGMVRYFSVNEAREKKYFKDYIAKRARGIKYLYGIAVKSTKKKG